MKKFSRNYNTYQDWLFAHSKDNVYNRRIKDGHEKYPNASLSQLRGHAVKSKKQKPVSKMKPVKNKRQKTKDRSKTKFKRLHNKITKKIKTFKEKNFPYYVFGLFIQEEYDELYSDNENEPDTYYQHEYYSKGIKSKTDFLDFLTHLPLLYVFWIYRRNGKEITLKTLAKAYNMTLKEAWNSAYDNRIDA